MAAKKSIKQLNKIAVGNIPKAKSFFGGGTSFGGSGSGVFSQFEAAKMSNKRSWIQTPWPNDTKRAMTVFDRNELTRKMRWLYVNQGLLRQIICDAVNYSIGEGIKAQAASGNSLWDVKAEKFFHELYNRPCEVTGRFNMKEVQKIIVKRYMIDGEIFALKTFDKLKNATFQIIESHRVGMTFQSGTEEEGVFDGIAFDKYGKVIGYQCIQSSGKSRLIPAPSMMHVFQPDTVTGARAYSPLQHSINNLIDVMEILSLEKVAMKANADIVRTIEREGGQFEGDADYQAFGMRPQDYPNGISQNPDQVGNFIGGKILALAPGESLKSFESQRPNPTFTGFLEYNLKDSCAGTLPYSFVMDPEKLNGATARMTLSKVERFCADIQQMVIDRFLIPAWGYYIGHKISTGELEPNDNWHRVNWVTPRRVTVDAGREAAANQKDIQLGLKTISDHYAEQGMDVREQVRRRAADARLFIDAAEEAEVPLWMIYKPDNTPNADIDQGLKESTYNPDGEDVPLPSAGNPY